MKNGATNYNHGFREHATEESSKSKAGGLLGASTRIEDLRVENLADPLDQINSALDREMTMSQLDARAHLVQDIRAALDAINEGTYGFCESCEENPAA